MNGNNMITQVEHHPLRPFLPQNAKVLFLGSFPPQKKRWSIDFFYPNYINDHWRLCGQIFYDNKNYFVDTARKTFKLNLIKDFLYDKGIAYYDTATVVRRLKDNASDKFLEIVTPTNIPALIALIGDLRAIATTGELATQTICCALQIDEVPKVGCYTEIKSLSRQKTRDVPIYLYRLPSSSRAYPLAFDKKVEAYKRMYEFVGLL